MELIKVAIADSNTLLCEGLKRILANESDLLVVGDAASEIELAGVLERTDPHILLLDLNMGKDAVSVLLDLKKKNLPTKVLILSLFPDRERILNTAKAGACGYLLKRATSTTLFQAIRWIHRGGIWVDRRLNCADMFLEFAQHAWIHERNTLETRIARALSDKELEVLVLVGKGYDNQKIANLLFVSVATVKAHMNHIFNKLNIRNRTEAALICAKANPDELVKKAGGRHRRHKEVIRLYPRSQPSHAPLPAQIEKTPTDDSPGR